MPWNNQVRSVRLAGLFMITAPLCGVAETIANPMIHGQVVDRCPVINGAADCQRVMATADALCRYGFRHAGTYHPRQKSPRGLQLKLSIDNQETIHSEWAAGASVHLLMQLNAPIDEMVADIRVERLILRCGKPRWVGHDTGKCVRRAFWRPGGGGMTRGGPS